MIGWPDADRVRALHLLEAIAGRNALDPAQRCGLVIPGDPRPWKRAAIRPGLNGQLRVFKDHRSRADAFNVQRSLMAIGPRPFSTSNLALVLIFYLPNHRAMDKDNLEKLVLDAGTKAGLWVDDRQITASATLLELDAAAPRTVLALARTTSTLDRTVHPGRRAPSRRKGVRP